MKYALIGAGNLGLALAGHFAGHHIDLALANSRGAPSLQAAAEALGSAVRAVDLDEALEAEVIVLAIPFIAHPAIGARKVDWQGQVIVDAMNTYGIDPATLKGQPSTAVVARAFPGAKVVKAFNQLPAKVLARDPGETTGRRVVFIAGDDAGANVQVEQLVQGLGFAPLVLGDIASASPLIGMGGPLILKNLVRQD